MMHNSSPPSQVFIPSAAWNKGPGSIDAFTDMMSLLLYYHSRQCTILMIFAGDVRSGYVLLFLLSLVFVVLCWGLCSLRN